MEGILQGSAFTTGELMIRVGAALVLGLILGIDREYRGIAAGLRTHALVCVSACVITLSALDLYESVRAQGGDSDPLRVIQGLAQAIGFIAAGAIFFSRGDIHNLTTAANIWLTAAAGIAAGAGQLRLALIATAVGVLTVTALRLVEYCKPGDEKKKE